MQRHLVAKSLLLGKRPKRLSDPSMPKWLVLSNCLWFSVCGFFFPLILIFMLVFQTFKTTFQFYFILYPYSFDYYFFLFGMIYEIRIFFFNSILHELFSSVKFSFYYFTYDLFYLWWFLIYFVLKFHPSWVLLLIKFDSFFC